METVRVVTQTLTQSFNLQKLHFSVVVQEDNLSRRAYGQMYTFIRDVYKHSLHNLSCAP